MVGHVMENPSDFGIRSCKPSGSCKVFRLIESDIPDFFDVVVREHYPVCFSVQGVPNQACKLCRGSHFVSPVILGDMHICSAPNGSQEVNPGFPTIKQLKRGFGGVGSSGGDISDDVSIVHHFCPVGCRKFGIIQECSSPFMQGSVEAFCRSIG